MSNRGQTVILTHEHTDFDALASLLGASLLFPDARPLLPYQMNRNVREFVTLYRNQFPFLHPRELARAPIERVILVDTRSANLPKGIQEETQFQVIDHHSLDASLPDGWQLWSEPVGANVTLLVEKLMEGQCALTSVQATLLALGIHEDTGSLTYDATTYRDVRALAWLMEPQQGVNLEVLGHFLQHPLSDEQRAILQTLVDNSEFIEVEGHTVVIATATAPAESSELSTLAHRLRNIHEPDALFLVVDLGEIIQVVARSTTDAIDVAVIMTALTGGGHPRAAAASLRDQSASWVRNRIIELLQEKTQATVTVRQIMSVGRPQILTPDLPITEAAVLMRRYGHEGFPVVELATADGTDHETLIGVITRREADRAINHGLGDAPIRRFMQAGQITVQPTDSVQQLRRAMIESGWGQIPVVDGTGAIIGIVTRTDLIKLWDETGLPQRPKRDVDARLAAVLPPVQYALLQLLGSETERMGYMVYVVGGFVRDLLLAQATRGDAFDMDIVIEGDAIAFAEQMQARYGGRIVPHRRFGTAKWLLADADYPLQQALLLDQLRLETAEAELPPHLDFVTARTEFYTAPTVLPTVERSSIKLDLHRRDFTINTLALCLNPERWGELLDFYGGVADLEKGMVRVLHSLSFVDDPTRILRAVRYEQRFGFQIGARTLELLRDARELLDRVTAARIRHELERLLEERTPEKALQRLYDLQVLQQIHEQLLVDEWLHTQFARLRAKLAHQPEAAPLRSEPLPSLYWGLLTLRLPAAVHMALQERLGLNSETQRLMAGLHVIREHEATLADPTLRPSAIVMLLDRSTAAALALYIELDLAPPITECLQTYVAHWQQIRPSLDGRDLQVLGFKRGPLYGQILNALRAALLDGVISSRADEIALAHQVAAQNGGN